MKEYRPRDPDRASLLIELARSGKRLRDIAMIYGGTEYGVRSNLRRLRERGVL
jgi:hypothetical protein